jgi:hypothetical protein
MFGLRNWNVVNIDDILYTPLDVPDVPECDAQELISWLEETHTQYKSLNKLIASEGYSSEAEIKNYPWNLTPIYLNVSETIGGGWVNQFDTKFPQICDHISNAYGLELNDIGAVYSLPMKKDYSGWGFWHQDFDASGIRLYLEFESYEEDSLFGKLGNEEGDGTLCKIKSRRQSFYINNISCVHATYTSSSAVGKVRVAAFILPKFDNQEEFMQKTKQLILNSAEKYKKTYARFL